MDFYEIRDKMKDIITLVFCIVNLPVFSQTLSFDTGETYAVVVGISDYQDEQISDLRFAHKDAEAFAQFLQSPSGGNLSTKNLKILVNEQATTARVAAALEWLVEVCKEGDQAIIYYSGHGDVENKTMFQLGYLLTWDAPARTYVAGAFPLSYLQAIVSTLSLRQKSKVVLITDACRAGKLAGTSIGGPQLTNANLSKQFANEVKILSCQPDEFSIEGEQWGGGRGAFSYHLVDGLYGLADRNSDGQVNLFEIGRYLEDKVSSEAAPHNQFPMTVGGKLTQLAVVDPTTLDLLREERANQTPMLTAIESKGFEETILAEVDSSWQKKYWEFVAAVDAGHLLEAPEDTSSAAYDLYLELSKVTELERLHGTMKRNLAAALQDDAQQAVNAYLASNSEELKKRYFADSDYERYPKYLRKAAELLGEQNFYYPFIMAKLHYFEGVNIRLKANLKSIWGAGTYPEAIKIQEKALTYQEHAPFILNELGVLHIGPDKFETAVSYFGKAIELAPEWGLPYLNLSITQYYYYIDLKFKENFPSPMETAEKLAENTEKLIETAGKLVENAEKAIELMPDYPQLYNFLALIKADLLGLIDASFVEGFDIEMRGDFYYPTPEISSDTLTQKFKESIELLEKAVAVDSTYTAGYFNLGTIYLQIEQLDKAEFYLKEAVRFKPDSKETLNRLGYLLRKQKNYEEAIKVFKQVAAIVLPSFENGSINLGFVAIGYEYGPNTIYNSIGECYRDWGKENQALSYFKKAVEYEPRFGTIYYTNIGDIYYERGDFKRAEWHYLKEIRKFWGSASSDLVEIAQFYMKMKRYEFAEWLLLYALDLTPDYEAAQNTLDKVRQGAGEPNQESGRYYLENCVYLAKILKGRQTPLSRYRPKGDSVRIKSLYEKAISLQTDSLSNREQLALAEAYWALGDRQAARDACPEKVDPEYAFQHKEIGTFLLKLGRTEQAESHFQAFIQKSKEQSKESKIGRTCYRNGESKLAEKYFLRVQEINPDDRSLVALEMIYFSTNEVEKALKMIDKRIAKEPKNIHLKIRKANFTALYDTSDEPGKAFESLIPLQPELAQIRDLLNLIQANKFEEATAVYKAIDYIKISMIIIGAYYEIPYVRMLVSKGDLDAAMDIIEDPIFLFSYSLLHNYPGFAPLHETERFKAHIRKHYPGKVNRK